ncbi:MAG TPA: hypothetical protein VGJ84_06310, partial [Polyangiaceae bacterium]
MQTSAVRLDTEIFEQTATLASTMTGQPETRKVEKWRMLSGVALATTLVSLFATLGASGIWDPPELEVADLSRRIALNLLGAHGLAIEGGDNTVPTQGA